LKREDILIIGSDSFIARNFITKYQEKFNLTLISRKFTGQNNEFVISNFERIPIEFFGNKSVVINFAAIVHHKSGIDDDLYYKINCDLALLNAQKAKNAGTMLFIQISSIAVYGSIEEISPFSVYYPTNAYAKSKLKADKGLIDLETNFFKIAILRSPMVYGVNAPGNLERLMRFVNIGIPLPFAGIDNRRSFINVFNLIQYLAIIADKKMNGIFLIADKDPISTEHLLRLLIKSMGKERKLFRLPSFLKAFIRIIRPNEYNKLFCDSIVKPNFPYETLIQHHTIDEGIREMVNSKKYNNIL
jgi:UDP-glucose 4-epimerase